LKSQVILVLPSMLTNMALPNGRNRMDKSMTIQSTDDFSVI
jgi:hypothetical protein